jgi:hypothetical protein
MVERRHDNGIVVLGFGHQGIRAQSFTGTRATFQTTS